MMKSRILFFYFGESTFKLPQVDTIQVSAIEKCTLMGHVECCTVCDWDINSVSTWERCLSMRSVWSLRLSCILNIKGTFILLLLITYYWMSKIIEFTCHFRVPINHPLHQWSQVNCTTAKSLPLWRRRYVRANLLKSAWQVTRQTEVELTFVLIHSQGITDLSNRRDWPLAVMRQVLEELMNETPSDLLAK